MQKKAKQQNPEASEKPFFARFLENQEIEQATGGKPPQTQKFPSDGDEI